MDTDSQTPETELEPEGLALAAARFDLAIATEIARAAAITSIALGMSEAEAARRYGVTRMTIRAWRQGMPGRTEPVEDSPTS